uniref:ABC transmembrane type-1 domain-containing protein n=1 Tax=Haemonchus contortus TaxID=6289 RepID=A0A7I5E881_HAECO
MTLSAFLGAGMSFIVMGMQIGIVVLSLTALIVIITFNKASYKKRHDARIRLASRYQLDENIRIGSYLIPVACNDMLTKVLILMLLTYSVFFKNVPIGQDTTHLSHAFDLLMAYQRMFFGLALTIRSEKFDHIMKRHTRTAVAVQNQIAATSNYHDGLKQMW